MTIREEINEEYFEWLYGLVFNDKGGAAPYEKLLMHLHNTEFTYSIPMDKNRASDGIDLRYRFAYDHPDIYDAESYLTGPCSVLEMMVALALDCEENIMDDPCYGNRTGQWFWGMISNLGLSSMTDNRYDSEYVDYVIDRFLNREYDPDGKGGLFRIKDCDEDLRKVQIWYQLLWYLDSIV